ncbi:MAG: hypothetical protein JNJ55_05780 [Betaproteobacteria bacterium]|nr:hypothetical protein [Betaproteobacteria bacterium]
MKRALAISMIVSGWVCPVAAESTAPQPVFAGFIEDRSVQDPAGKGFGNRQVFEAYLRVAFVKEKGEWQGLCSQLPFKKAYTDDCDLSRFKFPAVWNGFGAFDQLDRVRLEKPSPLEWGNLALFEISGFNKPSTEDERRWVYGGHWHVPSHRPVAMATVAPSADPDQWMKTDLRSDTVPRAVVAHVLNTFSKLEKCVPNKPMREQPIQGQLRMNLKDGALRLKEHHQARGRLEMWKVEIPDVAIQLCGTDFDHGWGKPRSRQVWVYRDTLGRMNSLLTPHGLRNFGASDKFELISTRDLDADGKGEVVFWYSGYVHDGYVLFFEGMTRMATFTWGYH